jgi:hypothetical protein
MTVLCSGKQGGYKECSGSLDSGMHRNDGN